MSPERESEKYMSWEGKELRTPRRFFGIFPGKVITVADVAGEAIKHSDGVTMDSLGRIQLPTEGGYKLFVDPNDPNKTEWAAFNPEGKRKINSVEMWKAPNPAKSQLIFIENDYRGEKGTVGEISPLVIETPKGSWVAVQHANRFNNQYDEAFRRGWTRPVEEAPKLKTKKTMVIRKYTDEQLGLTVVNDARIEGPDGRKALISQGLTVVTITSTKRPKIEGASWMRLEKFLTMTEEGMGMGAISKAVNFGYIHTDKGVMDQYLEKLPAHVRKVKREQAVG